MEVVLSSEQESFIDSVITSKNNVVLLGKAGVGKSVTIRALIDKLKILNTTTAILAPTGIAALNIGGTTIHRFLATLRKSQSINLSCIIIDECSMLRADLFDSLNTALIKATKCYKPFGGVQIVLVGDLRQLPPVVTPKDSNTLKIYKSPYFFSSTAFGASSWQILELTKIFRQKDEEFLAHLNNLRVAKSVPDFGAYLKDKSGPALGTVLTPTNVRATLINETKLASLEGSPVRFNAKILGEFDPSSYPCEPSLVLKNLARVIVVKNIYEDEELIACNGDIGTVVHLSPTEVMVKLNRTGSLVNFQKEQVTWENYSYDFSNGDPVLEVIGTFSQIPLRLAWAITVHKSQGMTLDPVTIDLTQNFFASGQAYVAFSRASNPENLRTIGSLDEKDVFTCEVVDDFLENKMESKYVNKTNPEDFFPV